MAKLYFRYGTMNSGKSIDVLKTAHNYEEQGKKVILFTPAIDTRAGQGIVASRIGIQQSAFAVDADTDIYAVTAREKPRCVLVDEAQFLSPEQVGQLCRIVDEQDIPVIAYGLRTDFKGKLFPGSYELMALADKIEEVKTICWYCEKKAIMNMRCKDGQPVFEGAQIQIGGNESYVPVCRKCYMSLKNSSILS